MKNLSNKKTKKKGFTLIELIIVLAVMAIIAAIAIPSFSAVKNSSKKKADLQSCETIRRTVLTLVADETVTASADTSVTVTVNSSNVVTVTPADATKLSANAGTLIHDALSEVKAPQTATATGYTISITKDGSVTVKVAPDSLGIEAK